MGSVAPILWTVLLTCVRKPQRRFHSAELLAELGNSANLNPTEITLVAWVFPVSFPNPFPNVVTKHDQLSGTPQWGLFVTSTGQAHVNVGGDEGAGSVVAGTVPLNEWTHLAATYDGSTVRLYVNGQEVGSATDFTGPLPAFDRPASIGKEADLTIRNFDGRIDEAETYDRVLEASDILAGFDAGSADKCQCPL